MPDVARNDRVFSDGVGTCSSSVLEVIHEAYGQSRMLKPTLLQIRFQGMLPPSRDQPMIFSPMNRSKRHDIARQ